jgi:hypothetical protein
MHRLTKVLLLGGPYDRHLAALPYMPERISVGLDAAMYARMDDPDTGEPLGAYVWEGAPRELRAL